MGTELVIETHGLTKRYGRRTAVEALDLAVPPGVVAGFIGPNGAGKTTTMGMLLGLISSSAGTGSVLGAPLDHPRAYLSQVGALIEQPAFYGGLTGYENLAMLATVCGYGKAQIPELLETVGLAERGDDRFQRYSLGMKQRLGIAASLLGDPTLLVLDEPTNGLDPGGIREMRELIAKLADGGRTVFVSSHVLAELQQVCDWFVMIENGRLVFQGRATELMKGAASHVAIAPEHPSDLERLRQMVDARGYRVVVEPERLLVESNGTDPRAVAADLNRAAGADGVVLVELNVTTTSLEERYMSLVNGGKQ